MAHLLWRTKSKEIWKFGRWKLFKSDGNFSQGTIFKRMSHGDWMLTTRILDNVHSLARAELIKGLEKTNEFNY